MNRRGFLAAGLASLGAACGLPQPKPETASPRVSLSDVKRLVAQRVDPIAGRCRYVADLGTRRLAQPILYARSGESFDALIENALPQPTTVHFHGLTLPQSQDGAGFDPIAPGASKRVRFQVQNRSGLYWFHPHPQGFTAEQVYAGLAGLLVVTDEEDQALDAALALAPPNRLALAIADARVEKGLIRPYAPSAADCVAGWIGNQALVNGKLDAGWTVAPGWVRLQILNACNARGLLLGFQDRDKDAGNLVPFHLLGTDGGLLATPRDLDRVFLHGGERVDIAIDVNGRRALHAVSLEFDARHHAQSAPAPHRHPARERYAPLAQESVCETSLPPEAKDLPSDGGELALFTLRVEGRGPDRAPALPARLSALSEASSPTDAPTRRIRLDFDERTGFAIDQAPYAIDETGFAVGRGAREIWEIKNSPISMPHPMHVHGFGFRVLRRQGTFGAARRLATEPGGRFPTDLGLKDTVLAWPNETLWLALDFALPPQAAFGGPQRYMFHCHNLEHEDAMMMRNITVT